MSKQQIKTIAIFGCGYIGIQVAHSLIKEGYHIILCDSDEQAVDETLNQGLLATVIDYTDDNEIKVLGIGDQVDVLFATFEEDSANVFVTMSARWLDPDLHIIALANNEIAANSLIAAGCNRVLEPYEMMGREIYNLISRPIAMEVLSNIIFGDENLVLAEITLTQQSPLCGCTLQACLIDEQFDIIFIGIISKDKAPQMTFSQTKEEIKLNIGDILVVIGNDQEIERLKQKI